MKRLKAREERLVEETLDNAKGFIDTNQQDQFDECESAVNDVLRRIRRIAPQWKVRFAIHMHLKVLLTASIGCPNQESIL